MIRLSGIHKAYQIGGKPLPVLRDVCLSIATGEMLAVMGSSGSGKSTLLNILGLLDDYDRGDYFFGDELMGGLAPRRAAQLRNRYIGFVFQTFNLLAFKTAAENVALPLYYQRVPRRKRLEVASGYLERVGLADRANHRPAELSGGEQQRVAIARALVTRPRLILADEPTGALDSTTSQQIIGLLQEVNAEGITVVIVTHEPDISSQTGRIVRLRDGVLEADGN